ncbi:MAG: hypothetical protein Q8O00_14715 [Holophaga sp.]|nr:hypothetical protein [Holophaga sp.]
MTNRKHTSAPAASAASRVLQSPDTSPRSKSVAGAALRQARPDQAETSRKVATKASEVLRDGRTSRDSKTAAGSAEAQAKGHKKR